MPLLEKNRKIIESVRRETMKYGDTERHMVSLSPILILKGFHLIYHRELLQLDVYYPPPHEGTKPPILIFVYGGAFIAGDRVFPAPADLIYKCVGAFYASRGFLTIIPDYRLRHAAPWRPR